MTEVSPLLYERDLPETFAFVTDLGYEGWFTFEGAHHPFSRFVAAEHANPAQFGKRFMSTNVFFVPSETDGAALLGP
jgi:hypothetical protein